MTKHSISAEEQLIKTAIIETKDLIADLKIKSVLLAADIKTQRLVLRSLNTELRKLHPSRIKY